MSGQKANDKAAGYVQAVEWCLDFWFPGKAGVDEAARSAVYRQHCKEYLKSYYLATFEYLDQLGLRKAITPEEFRQLCLFKLLHPTELNLKPAVFMNQSEPEIGIRHSGRDYDRNLSICLSFAYRKGVHDELKGQEKAESHVDEEGLRDKGLAENRDREGEAQNSPNIFRQNNRLKRNPGKLPGWERRAEIEQCRRELLGKMQTQFKSRRISEAYMAGRLNARCAICPD
jgi:hypothetical protein